MRVLRRGRTILFSGLLLMALGLLPARPAGADTASERWCPPETGVCAEGAFYDFWRANGGLEILGYPIDQPRRRPDGLIVQYYERAIMEWHPENGADYQVLLTRLGAALADGNPHGDRPPVLCDADCALLSQTGHTVRGPFLEYWTRHGGLPVYGFPLTEEYRERNAADGQAYTVQYFERNRFEHHPEHAGTRYEVLLGRLGAEALAARGDEVHSWAVVRTPVYATDRRAAMVATATVLVEGVPEARYLTATLAGGGVTWHFDGDLPADVLGVYSFRANAIRYHPILLAMDPHALAAVLAHEGQHAHDFLTYGPPRSRGECLTLEYRGFLAEAALWESWWGPRGKPDPANDFERAENAILDDIRENGGRETQRFITAAYAGACGTPDPAQMDDAPEWRGIPATTEGLPAHLTRLFPDAGDQLARIAGEPTLAAAATGGAPAPAWPKR